MANLRRFQTSPARNRRPIDPTAGAEFGALAQTLESFTEQEQTRLDRQAAEGGFIEGQDAGSQGEFDQTGSDRTIRGRAFNQGVMASHQAAIQTDVRDSVDRFELDNPDNPELFDAQVEGLAEGLLAEADPNMRAFVRQRIADYSGRAKTRVIERQYNKAAAQASEDLQRGVEGMVEDATTAALEGDPLMVEARRQEIAALLETGVAGNIITEDGANALLESLEDEILGKEIVGTFDRELRNNGLEAGNAAIRRWQKTKPSSVNITPEQHEAVTRQMITLHNREEGRLSDEAARNTAANKAARRAATSLVTDNTAVLKAGFPIDPQQADEVTKAIQGLASTGSEEDLLKARELAVEFDTAQAIQSTVHAFRNQPEDIRTTQLNAARQEMFETGANRPQVDLVKALEAAHNDETNAMATDPLGHMQRMNRIEVPPLDEENFVESLAARDVSVASQMAGKPVGKFTKQEATQFAQRYRESDIETRVGMLSLVAQGAQGDVEATLAQLDAENPMIALLGGYAATGRALLARNIMLGQAVLASEPAVKPKAFDFNIIQNDLWGSALSYTPDHLAQRAVFSEAAMARYASLKQEAGDLTEEVDGNLLEQAMQEVMPTSQYNGWSVALPVGVHESTFSHWIDGFDESTFEGLASGTSEELLDQFRSEGRLIEAGNGAYGIELVSAATGLHRPLTIDEKGTPLILRYPRAGE